ncbi:MAG: hypothetical protein IJ240_06290, partial [Clostridia bacterium]|nr:hypothetical protein [Clostridia bacterium]
VSADCTDFHKKFTAYGKRMNKIFVTINRLTSGDMKGRSPFSEIRRGTEAVPAGGGKARVESQ